jgi:Ca2+-binding RTX toxin-like protein
MIPISTQPQPEIADDTPVRYGTDQNDFMRGTTGNDILAGVGGHDSLHGGDGNDDLDGGLGNDQLYGQDGNDFLNGGPGMDFLFGGAGHNVLRGGAGSDLYLVGGLHSADVIDNGADAAPGDTDMILFERGISPDQVLLRRQADDLLIRVAHRHSLTRVQGYFSNDGDTPQVISELKFDDETVWNIAMVKSKVLRGSAGADHLIGYESTERIEGRAGNDVLEGRGGRDLLLGGEGDDVLDGGTGNDFIGGGAGNDRLIGGAGSDHYFFENGSGHDLIVSDGNVAGDADRVHLRGVMDECRVWFRRTGDDLMITITDRTDSLQVKDWFAGASAGFDSVGLTNGKSILPAGIDALVTAMAAMPAPSTGGQGSSPHQSHLLALIASNWQLRQDADG